MIGGVNGWLTDWLVEWLTTWPTGRLNTWLTGWLNGWLTCWIADRLTTWLVGWLADWLTTLVAEWLAGWMGDWLTGWMEGWLNDWLTNWLTPRTSPGFLHVISQILTWCKNPSEVAWSWYRIIKLLHHAPNATLHTQSSDLLTTNRTSFCGFCLVQEPRHAEIQSIHLAITSIYHYRSSSWRCMLASTDVGCLVSGESSCFRLLAHKQPQRRPAQAECIQPITGKMQRG